ncbi:MAG: M55 family metallopeptidase [Trueperaceae bacterium]|nr:M55 family metallopeptidase [Trueperaceae bacterium]
MRIYIAADIEGVAGLVNTTQTMPGGADYERARSLFAGEVNAAIEASMASGATYVVVNDGHGPNTNLRAEDLDPRAELITGRPKPLNMVHGINDGFDAILFIGYHAKAGTQDATLDHTYFSTTALDIRVNGVSYGEFGLNGMLAGYFGTPTVLASGDDKLAYEAAALVPGIETVVVKHAVARTAARSTSPTIARTLISDATKRALSRLKSAPIAHLLPPKPPLTLEVSFLSSGQADTAALLPESKRHGARTVIYEAPDYYHLFRACRALLLLGAAGS